MADDKVEDDADRIGCWCKQASYSYTEKYIQIHFQEC